MNRRGAPTMPASAMARKVMITFLTVFGPSGGLSSSRRRSPTVCRSGSRPARPGTARDAPARRRWPVAARLCLFGNDNQAPCRSGERDLVVARMCRGGHCPGSRSSPTRPRALCRGHHDPSHDANKPTAKVPAGMTSHARRSLPRPAGPSRPCRRRTSCTRPRTGCR